ncbi:MAG: cell cycle histidine kinase CckA [Rhizobiaceae bacterium]
MRNDRQLIQDVREPMVNTVENSAGIGRFILLGFFLFLGVAVLGVFGTHTLGEPTFLAILGVFASVGIFFLFSLALGMVQLSSHRNADDFTKSLISEMDAGVVVTDAENRVVYANQAYADLLGAENPADIANVESTFARYPEASETMYKMSNAVKSGKSAIEEIRLSSGIKTGQEGARWFRLRVRAMNSPTHRKQLAVWQISDVTTDRIEQENAFQTLQDAIHYLDHAPAGFMSTENDGSLMYVNATLADWLGLDLVRFEAGTLGISQLITGENLTLFNTLEATQSASKTSVVDLDMTRSDGKLLPVRLYSRNPYSSDAAPGSLRTLVLNRSAEMGDSDALRDAEIRFTRFFNNTPIAIAGINADGKIVRTNAPFQSMFASVIASKGASEQLDYQSMVSDDETGRVSAAFEKALEGVGKIDPLDLSIDGEEERFVRFFFNQVSDQDLDVETEDEAHQERVIVYAMEVTEQRALENQFAKGQKMQAVGQLAGGIAHDFNNVLTAIIGFSDLLLGNHKPSDPSFQDIMNIKQNANRAASLVRQLLAFSRRQTLRPQVLHLSDVLSDLRMLLDRLVGDRIDLDIKHGRDLWPIKADISQLEQVIVNLVVNARDAMNNEGNLKIRTRNLSEEDCASKFSFQELEAGEYVLIEVEDNGSGMSREIMEQVFEPFFSTKEVGKGTGLGLSTVYGIVKQTGGFIYPESEVDVGTTFHVFLPRHIVVEEENQEAGSQEEGAKEEPKKDLTGNATILLVEDEDAVRAFGSRALISRGYEVHEASSGVEALEVMEDFGDEIDLVVSDVVMPEMDGPTLLRELRKTHPDLKFIFVSGYAEEAFSKNLPEEEREKFGFLPKPFSLKQLATTVKEMLEE